MNRPIVFCLSRQTHRSSSGTFEGAGTEEALIHEQDQPVGSSTRISSATRGGTILDVDLLDHTPHGM
jgi:hypothetical protein